MRKSRKQLAIGVFCVGSLTMALTTAFASSASAAPLQTVELPVLGTGLTITITIDETGNVQSVEYDGDFDSVGDDISVVDDNDDNDDSSVDDNDDSNVDDNDDSSVDDNDDSNVDDNDDSNVDDNDDSNVDDNDDSNVDDNDDSSVDDNVDSGSND